MNHYAGYSMLATCCFVKFILDMIHIEITNKKGMIYIEINN